MQLPSERLPWLADEPNGGSVKAARRVSGTAMWPWYLLLLLLVAGVGTGAWWLSNGKEAAPPVLPAEESLSIPVLPQQPPEPSTIADEQPSDPIVPEAEPRPPEARRTMAPSRSQVSERGPGEPLRRASQDGEGSRGVFPADEPAAAPPATGPSPIVLYHPQPNRGRVVQLGAFPTRVQADATWRRITRRYPYLASKPKMVNTVDVRGVGGGRPTRMYRLQLGTSSQAQSVVICQQLERAGHSCVVVY